MFVANIGRCSYKLKGLNLTLKTIPLTWCRQCSDNEKNDSKKVPEKNKKTTIKRQKTTSLYTSNISPNDALAAKNTLKDLINEFKSEGIAKNKEVKTTTVQKTEREKGEKDKLNDEIMKTKSKFDKKLLNSVKNVAQTMEGDKNKTSSELIQVLTKFKIFQDDFENTSVENKVLKENKLKNLKQDKLKQKKLDEKKLEEKYKEEKKSLEKMHGILLNINKVEKNVQVEYDKLDIFTLSNTKEANNVELKFWNKLQNDELHYLIKSPPRNYYQEMIHWTEEGKLWHFPIDNEQGMDEEAKISFAEHVFLDHHLEPWCPKKGPLRHFMELVLVGLSKNPYLTVKDKQEHIYWFRDYFENKRKLLTSVGAFPSKSISPE